MKTKRKETAREFIMRALEYLDAAEAMSQVCADNEDKIIGYQLGVSSAKWNLEQLIEVLG